MRHLLFICSQNKLRSPTAEAIFSDCPGVVTDSAGLNHDAEVPLSDEQIEWADVIIVMEKAHRDRLNRRFQHALKGKRIAVLGIPDDYEFMDPVLVQRLKRCCAPYLP
ncbi:MAG: low molecular weight protein tyrosine phosphatase family protein [Verrucomicrobiota bacterium]